MNTNAHTTTVRVRYGETDQMGIVYHANYLAYFEIGRTELIRDAGASYAELERAGLLLPVTELAVHYRKPARYDDIVVIETRVTGVSRVTIRFEYVLRSPSGETLVEAHTVLACVNPDGRPRRLPEDFRNRITPLVARAIEKP